MTRPRPAVSLALRSAALIGIFSSPLAHSNPVPADASSLLNGAEYFERHCTECHGWNPDDQYTSLYDDSDMDAEELVRELQEEQDARENPPEDDKYASWPTWAGPPPVEEVDPEEELEADILEDMLSAIDEVYEDDADSYDWDMPDEEPDYNDEDFFYDESGEDFYEDLDRMPDATDLLDPESFVYGTSEVELFINIAEGTGPTMPGFREVLGEEEAIWDLVNYIRSLWGDDWVD